MVGPGDPIPVTVIPRPALGAHQARPISSIITNPTPIRGVLVILLILVREFEDDLIRIFQLLDAPGITERIGLHQQGLHLCARTRIEHKTSCIGNIVVGPENVVVSSRRHVWKSDHTCAIESCTVLRVVGIGIFCAGNGFGDRLLADQDHHAGAGECGRVVKGIPHVEHQGAVGFCDDIDGQGHHFRQADGRGDGDRVGISSQRHRDRRAGEDDEFLAAAGQDIRQRAGRAQVYPIQATLWDDLHPAQGRAPGVGDDNRLGADCPGQNAERQHLRGEREHRLRRFYCGGQRSAVVRRTFFRGLRGDLDDIRHRARELLTDRSHESQLPAFKASYAIDHPGNYIAVITTIIRTTGKRCGNRQGIGNDHVACVHVAEIAQRDGVRDRMLAEGVCARPAAMVAVCRGA